MSDDVGPIGGAAEGALEALAVYVEARADLTASNPDNYARRWKQCFEAKEVANDALLNLIYAVARLAVEARVGSRENS